MNVNKKNILKFVILIFGILLFVFLLRQTSVSALKQVLVQANPFFLAVAVFFGTGSSFLKSLRFGCVFPPGNRRMELYTVFALIRVLNLAFPFKSGEVVSLGYLKHKQFIPTIAEASPTWILLRIGDLLAICTFFVIACFTSDLVGIIDFDFKKNILILFLVSFVLAVLVLISWKNFNWITQNAWINSRFFAFQEGFARLKSPRIFGYLFFWSLMVWICLVASMTYGMMAFGASIGFGNCFFISTIVLAFGILPIHAPMGVGTEDAVWSGLMILAGIESLLAVAIALNLRLFILLLVVIDGLIFLILTGIKRILDSGDSVRLE